MARNGPPSWRSRLRIRAGRPAQPDAHTFRLANSIRIPVGFGLILVATIAVSSFVFVGRSGGSGVVPDVVVDLQEQVADDLAQTVRRSLNEGVDDVAEAAIALEQGTDDQSVLDRVAEIHGRYSSLYVVSRDGRVLARTGVAPSSASLAVVAPASARGIRAPRTVRSDGEERVVLLQYAPVSGRDVVVGAEYDPAFLRFPLSAARPGDAWVVDRRDRAFAGIDGAERLRALGRAPLREAARRATNGARGSIQVEGSLDRAEVVAYAPATGIGPAGTLGLGVVTARSMRSFDVPATRAQAEARVLGALLVVVAVLVFSWIWIVLVRPVLRLQRDAERVAFGDLTEPVEIVRYDEVGLIARALERMRVLLLRRRAEDTRSDSQR